MRPILRFPAAVHHAIRDHLLPRGQDREEAAFAFVRPEPNSPHVFVLVDWFAVPPEGFEVQLAYHFELTDETRARMIKRAHDLDASVVELHSHLGPFAAQFSPSDWSGFEQLVPHMFWRLKRRPYFALVFSRTGFDGMAWVDDPTRPVHLEGVDACGGLLEPTCLSSLERDGYDWPTV